MDCLVRGSGNVGGASSGTGTKNESIFTPESGTEEVTFLYKLSDGSSPRSYGINVARLAGLPQAVIELALKQSRAFEEKMLTAQAEVLNSKCGGSGVVAAGEFFYFAAN